MSMDIGKLTNEGTELLKNFVDKMGLEGAVIATSEGLEMASYFTTDKDADLIAADTATLLSVLTGALENADRGNLSEMIISADNGSIAIKDLGDDIAFATLASKGYKMGGLVVALKQFMKDIQAF